MRATIYSPRQKSFFIVGENESIFQSPTVYTGRLANLSARGGVSGSGAPLIGGFVVSGSVPKQVLIRGAGPALANFGVTNALAAPVLRVYDSSGREVAGNTGWSNGGDPQTALAMMATASRVGAFQFAIRSADAALLTTLQPGGYTFQVGGANGTGTALAELYDSDAPTDGGTQMINLSARDLIGTGNDLLIAGFTIVGPRPRDLLIRGVGPALAKFGVADALADPVLVLFQASRELVRSDDWGDGPQYQRDFSLQTGLPAGIAALGSAANGTNPAAGAFPFDKGSKDAAFTITLAPGSYTVQLSGSNGTAGTALLEIYDITGG